MYNKAIVFAWEFNAEELMNVVVELPGRIYISNKGYIPMLAVAYDDAEDKVSELIVKANVAATLGAHEICNLIQKYNIYTGKLTKNYQVETTRVLSSHARYKDAIRAFNSYKSLSANFLTEDENLITLNKVIKADLSAEPLLLCDESLEHKLFMKLSNNKEG